MKTLIYIIMSAAIFMAFYEQSKSPPNIYITIVCIVVFMFGMMRLSAKIPSKNSDNNDKNV